jgi:hypothetical protein
MQLTNKTNDHSTKFFGKTVRFFDFKPGRRESIEKFIVRTMGFEVVEQPGGIDQHGGAFG